MPTTRGRATINEQQAINEESNPEGATALEREEGILVEEEQANPEEVVTQRDAHNIIENVEEGSSILQEIAGRTGKKRLKLKEIAEEILNSVFEAHGEEGCQVVVREINSLFQVGEENQEEKGKTAPRQAKDKRMENLLSPPFCPDDASSGSSDQIVLEFHRRGGRGNNGEPDAAGTGGNQGNPEEHQQNPGDFPHRVQPNETPIPMRVNPFQAPPYRPNPQNPGPSRPQGPRPGQPYKNQHPHQYLYPTPGGVPTPGMPYYPMQLPNPQTFQVNSKLPYHQKIPEFQGGPLGSGGQSAPVFLRRVEQETYGPEWTDLRKIQLARESLSEEARERLNNATVQYRASWDEFKRDFLAVFQFDKGRILEYLEAFAPQRKEAEEVKAYLQRVIVELRNFTVDGEVMSDEEKLIRLRSICKRTLPKEILAPLCDRSASLPDIIQGIDDLDRLHKGSQVITEKKPLIAAITEKKEEEKDNAAKPLCLGCGKPGHWVAYCRVVQSLRKNSSYPQKKHMTRERGEDNKKLTCYGCGGNHKKIDCKKVFGVKCHNCGGMNHLARMCRKNQKNASRAGQGARSAQSGNAAHATHPHHAASRQDREEREVPQQRMPWHRQEEEEL